MTVIVSSEDHADAVLMGFDEPTVDHHTRLIDEGSGWIGVFDQYGHMIELSEQEFDYMIERYLQHKKFSKLKHTA